MPKHVIDTRQLRDRRFIDGFLEATKNMKAVEAGARSALKYSHPDSIVCGLFFEASTRTRLSFQSAAMKLGAGALFTENAGDFSSAFKGESPEHGARAIESTYDVLVMRHSEPYSVERVARVSSKPVVNAGDGNNQHPTQSLLDIYTIYEKFGRVDGLKVGFLGDIRNGRTVRSLAYLLAHCRDNELYFASPESLSLPDDMASYLVERGVRAESTTDVERFIGDVDVLYVTRVQQERLPPGEYEKVAGNYGKFVINTRRADMMKDGSVIMHPLPINTTKSNGNPEITPEVDNHPRAYYFQQSRNGVYARMVVLDTLLSGERNTLYGLILDMDEI